jgi:hypothetical protein
MALQAAVVRADAEAKAGGLVFVMEEAVEDETALEAGSLKEVGAVAEEDLGIEDDPVPLVGGNRRPGRSMPGQEPGQGEQAEEDGFQHQPGGEAEEQPEIRGRVNVFSEAPDPIRHAG